MRKTLAFLIALVMVIVALPLPAMAEPADSAAALAAGFADPSAEFFPGVRWWWPGGAVDEETLIAELDYLAEKNISYVEINPFHVSTVLEGDEERVASIYTPEFYALLDVAITHAEELGITVDLNMGSGWNANSQYVSYAESMGNMALGRATVSGAELAAGVAVPEAERSAFYVAGGNGEWQDDAVVLQGVLVAAVTGTGFDFVPGEGGFMGPTPSYEEVYNADGSVLKSYDTQIVLDRESSVFVPASDIADGTVAVAVENAEAEYEVVAMYFIPSGGKGIDAATDWYVVDHMDGGMAADYINNWLGDENLSAILEKHSNIRAIFNDSYEFYSDLYYTESMLELAADAENNGIGYDFTKYLPTVYRQYSAAPFYMGLGTKDTYLTYTLDEGEKARIAYDYNVLVNIKFQEGMEAFQNGANEYGLLYRQEAYNPPIDTIGSAQYVDIPEAEQASELDLIRAASGAHLYGRNLVTCEQYTLGRTPLANTLEQFKIGYDIMATSGVNNFQYHGMMYGYGVDSEAYGELGWRPFPGIGMNFSERNTLSEYFDEMNIYAARANFLMQQGAPSVDVAYYMPFNSSLSLNDVTNTLNANGVTWEAINDASIVSEDTTVVDGKISANGGNMVYDVLVVDAAAVPVATMEKLAALAENGAVIVFYGAAPAQQPGYCDGNYAEADALTAAAAAKVLEQPTGYLAENTESFAAIIAENAAPTVSYADNGAARLARRTLDDGSEVVYLRNISDAENTITLKVSDQFDACYWLDLSTGAIYAAEKAEDGTLVAPMRASAEGLTGMFGPATYSTAVALLCVAGDAEVAAVEGQPDVFLPAEAVATMDVDVTFLTVGDAAFEGDVVGLWNSDEFQGGALKYSDVTGAYEGCFSLETIEEGRRIVLVADGLNGAATISINGVEVGDMLITPSELDVTEAVQAGENSVTLSLVPRKYNALNPDADTETLVNNGLAGGLRVEIR